MDINEIFLKYSLKTFKLVVPSSSRPVYLSQESDPQFQSSHGHVGVRQRRGSWVWADDLCCDQVLIFIVIAAPFLSRSSSAGRLCWTWWRLLKRRTRSVPTSVWCLSSHLQSLSNVSLYFSPGLPLLSLGFPQSCGFPRLWRNKVQSGGENQGEDWREQLGGSLQVHLEDHGPSDNYEARPGAFNGQNSQILQSTTAVTLPY